MFTNVNFRVCILRFVYTWGALLILNVVRVIIFTDQLA
jgi:hypothetical protein